MSDTPFENWAVLEILGHRQRPGYVKEVEIAGGKMLRVDIPYKDGDVTEYYGTSSIYSIRPCAEDVVRDMVDRMYDDRPMRPLEYKERDSHRLEEERPEPGEEF